MITASQLKEIFNYDPKTGVFTRLIGVRGASIGSTVGTSDKDGYCQISVGARSNKKTYKAHRLVWLYMTGDWPTMDIDHINGAAGDNRWANLRLATQKLNNANAKRRKDNKSGFKGVHWHARVKMWRAQITIDGRNIDLGYFSSPKDGHGAYMIAAKREFGEYARAQ